MKGFDEEFKDLNDFILKVTYRIWEEKQIHKIRDWYAKNLNVYTPTSVIKDVEEVVGATLETLNMFPDRELLAEEIIGEKIKEGLYYSSHRIFSNMTHKGVGTFGSPTGKLVKVHTVADCICEKNRVIREWLVRDQAAIVSDLGFDPEKFGRAQGKAFKKAGYGYGLKSMLTRWQGGPAPTQKKTHLIKQLEEGMRAIWNEGNLSIIDKLYDRAATSHVPRGEILNGLMAIRQFFNSWKSSFRNVTFKLEHFIENKENNKFPQISFRWTASGIHSGSGHFGKPSGAPIVIMAISHFEIKDAKIYRDFHLMDELSLWGQIAVNGK